MIIGLIVVLMFGLLIKLSVQKDEYMTVDVQLTGVNGWQQPDLQPPSWLIDSIKKGDVELSYSGKKVAEVLEIKSYEEGNKKISFLKLNLLVNSNKKQGTYRYKQKPLEVGSMIDVLVGSTRIYGSVTMIYDGKKVEVKKYKNVKIMLYQKQSWFADSIKVGDKVESGFGGNELQSQVISKKVKLSQIDKNLYKLVDIELEMKLQVDERGGVDYFANYQPIKVGNLLYIPMKNFNLYEASVVKIEDEN